MASPSPPPSGQTLDHTPALSPPSDLRHPPKSPEPHTSNMSSPQEESAPIADALALHVTKPTRAGISFLSLPPEIRNMIYNYIFTPVKDETCWTIYADISASVVKGFRRKCRYAKQEHGTCFAQNKAEDGLHRIFGITSNYTHSGILLTCRTVLGEAMPIALSHMHIYVNAYFSDFDSKAFKRFLINMRQPQGAFLSRLSYTYYWRGSTASYSGQFIQCINRLNIRIGYLEFHECLTIDETHKIDRDPVKHFVDILDGLDHQPARVAWAERIGYSRRPSGLESRRAVFNAAVQAWHKKLAISDADNLETAPPLLRDFLPEYLEQSD